VKGKRPWITAKRYQVEGSHICLQFIGAGEFLHSTFMLTGLDN